MHFRSAPSLLLLLLANATSGCAHVEDAAPPATFTTSAPVVMQKGAFHGHFASGCVDPATPCFELWLEQTASDIRGWHAAATAHATRIDGGDFYTQGAASPVTVAGSAHGFAAVVTVVSTYTGRTETGTLTPEGARLRWRTTAASPAIPRDALLDRR